MKPVLAIVGAGGTFAGSVLAGLLVGLWLDSRMHASYWTAVLLFVGLGVGAYAAYRLIAAAL